MAEKQYRYIGKSPLRIDACEKVTGRAVYTFDMELPGMLYAKCLHSPHARAEIVSIDISAAKKLAGVKVILTGKDIPYLLGLYMVDKRILAREKVRYQGEPVVAVAAVNEETAERALALIKVKYNKLPSVKTIDEALEGKILVHEDINELEYIKGVFFPQNDSNIASWNKTIKGNIQKGFIAANLIVKNELSLPPVGHVPIETHVAIAQANPYSNQLKVWSSTQSPFGVRQLLAKALGISRQEIQIIVPYVGGGFGGKAGIHLEPLVAILSKACKGRPVKLTATREEEFNQLPCRAGMRGRIKTGVTNDGKIIAMEIYYDWDSGAYADYGVNVGRAAIYSGAGPYDISNIELHSRTLYTNKVFSTAYRGFGHLETHWIIERQMDLVAQKLSMDPYEFRMKNILRANSITISGEHITENSGKPAKCIEAVIKAIEWEGYRSKEKQQAAIKTGKVRGKGIACLQKAPAMPPNTSSSAIMQMDEDGNVSVMVGAVDMGQGSNTAIAQIAAEVLDIPLEKVKVIQENDTDRHPYDWSTVASKYTFMGGNAVKRCAHNMVKQMKEIAVQILRCPIEELDYGMGTIFHIQHTHKRISYKDLAMGYVYEDGNGIGGPVIAHGIYMAEGLTYLNPDTGQGLPALDWTFGAHGVEIEVDIDTGEIKIIKIVSAFDVGQAINRKLVEGQIIGGVLQGIGSALVESFKFSKDGNLLNSSFTDNKIPTSKDIPIEIIPIIIEYPQADGPFGARGIGEHPMISVPSAIANALYDAIGINFYTLPMSPEKVALAIVDKISLK